MVASIIPAHRRRSTGLAGKSGKKIVLSLRGGDAIAPHIFGFHRGAVNGTLLPFERPEAATGLHGMKYRTSLVLYAAMWIAIVLLAFFMQVIPLVLVITVVGMAFGVTSPVALIALPLALFGTVVILCRRAERRRGNVRPDYFIASEQRYNAMALENDNGMRLTELRRRWLY